MALFGQSVVCRFRGLREFQGLLIGKNIKTKINLHRCGLGLDGLIRLMLCFHIGFVGLLID